MPAVQNVSCASPVLVVALAEAGPELSIERGVMEKRRSVPQQPWMSDVGFVLLQPSALEQSGTFFLPAVSIVAAFLTPCCF